MCTNANANANAIAAWRNAWTAQRRKLRQAYVRQLRNLYLRGLNTYDANTMLRQAYVRKLWELRAARRTVHAFWALHRVGIKR